jgi:tetratricopeptide (TPR) repeat protein
MARLEWRLPLALTVIIFCLSVFPAFVLGLDNTQASSSPAPPNPNPQAVSPPPVSDANQQATSPPPAPDPNASVEELEKQGDTLRAQKHYLDSLDFYQAAMLKHPTAMLWNKEGMAYLFMQRFPDGRKCFDRAIKMDKKAPEGYNNRGYIEQWSQHYGKAVRYYKKAMALRPGDAVFHYNLGSTYFALHDFPHASKELQTAYTLDPNIFLRVSRTGFMAQSSSPEDRATFAFMLARMYAQAGDFDRSIQYLRKAMEEGYKDMKKVYTESEFATLRTDKRFEELMAQRPQPLQ